MEQPPDQSGDPFQGPPLVLSPPPYRRAGLQRGPQPGQLRPAQPARRPARAPGRQRGGAAVPPAPPPHVRRITRNPQPPGHFRRLNPLREPLRGLQPHLLPPGPPSGGQATTIRIPHTPAIAPPAAPVTTTPRRAVTYCDNPDNSISEATPGPRTSPLRKLGGRSRGAPQRHRSAEPQPGRSRGEQGKSPQASTADCGRCLPM